jgi:CelD/BcsL family acetyltransferase involved in cellulose biosynthesis
MSCAVGIVDRSARSAVSSPDAAADRCEVVTDFCRLEELFSDWRRLWESDPRAEIFQTPEWGKAWWRAYGQNYQVRSVIVFAGHQVVGILPLVERNHFLQFLGTPEADYADVICEERRAGEVLGLALNALLECASDWEECTFLHLSRHSRVFRHYRTLPRPVRSRLHCIAADHQHTIILREQREEIFKSLLGKNHTRRLQNKLRKAGQLRFRHLETQQDAEQHLTEFFRHHIRRHAAIGRRSACASPEFQEFVRVAIQELGLKDKVRFGVLELDGRPLAWELGFQVNGKFLLYQHTFDMDASHYTPGEVLLWNALEYARDNVSREFDFGKGDELYKDRFANYWRETYSLFLEPRGLQGEIRGVKRDIEAFLQPALRKLKEVAKSNRVSLRAFRTVRMWLLGTAGCISRSREKGALVQYGSHALGKMLRNSIWSKSATVIFVAKPAAAGSNSPALASCDHVAARDVQLGDLVDLAWQHPEILTLNELSECRKRLKNGDRVYLAWDKSEVAIVCWASSIPAIGKDSGAGQGGAATNVIVVDQFWSARDRDLARCYDRLLSVLAREAANASAELRVHCGSRQPVLRQQLERQGFVCKYQSTRYRIFHWYQRVSISQAT